ncbi:P5 [Pseudomonas phage phi2954]|uniref:p5 n=1 Tax=Pseudomonas phage phi2954 TaxID=593131 RepID=C0KIU7_9VIRU|nr:P5 [Pseudomonas phage phi2954]ACM91132.1 P5 [Pseudomonas phage phi2954]
MSKQGGVKVAQAVAALSSPGLKIDGIVGKATRAAVSSMPSSQKAATDKILQSAGIGSLDSLLAEPAAATSDTFREVVLAVAREARKRGLNPAFYVAHIALETGWGRSVPKLPDGRSSYNYAGLKYAAVKTQVKGKTETNTLEYIKSLPKTVRDSFAVFASAGDFSRVYFWYLLDSPSAYRYPGLKNAKTAQEFGDILQKGGYATDPAYAAKVASIASTAVARYGSDVSSVA